MQVNIKSKALDRLEHLRLGIQYINQDESPAYISQYEEDINIIEAALKRSEELEIENSEQFKERWVQDNLAMTFELNVANKKLNALEIIKDKYVNFALLKTAQELNEYNHNCCGYSKPLTQEEFDLLKELCR